MADQGKCAGKVRLYAFYNWNVDKEGAPFSLCDTHYKSQPIPQACILNKLADKSVRPCENFND